MVVQHAHGIVQSALLDRVATWGGFAAGVDLFFVISGFVIARSLLPAIEAASDPRARIGVIGAFWIRRAFRLWPAAWLWLGIVLVGSMIAPRDVFGNVTTNAWALVAGVANFANARFAYAFGRWFYGGTYQYWSLSVEEQFYLVFPFVALLGRRTLLGAALLFGAMHAAHNNPIFDWPYRGGGIAYGVVLALAERQTFYTALAPRWLKHAAPSFLTTALLLALLLRADSGAWHAPARYSLVAAIGTVLVWIASYGRGYVWSPRVLRPVLLWLGARSYALYLVHVPVLLALAAMTRAAGDVWRAYPHAANHLLSVAASVVMLLLADATHRFVEQPFRARGYAMAARRPA